jgi:transcriptional regulator with XRE-family HTH domain
MNKKSTQAETRDPVRANSMELRHEIRAQRIAAGITVSTLARELRKTRPWLSLRECGKTRVSNSDATLIFTAIKKVAERRLRRVSGVCP